MCEVGHSRFAWATNYTRAMMTIFSHVHRTLFFLTECVKLTYGVRESKLICACVTFAHAVCKEPLFARKTSTKSRVLHTPLKNSYFRYKCDNSYFRYKCDNSYFRYKCEKVILSSWGRLRPSEARLKRPHEDKITFSLVYRTQFFYTNVYKV